MFFGVTSSRNSGLSRCRRQRLRSATATAFLASSWPTICASSAATIALGVSASFMITPFAPSEVEGRWSESVSTSLDTNGSRLLTNCLDRQPVVGENADFRGDLHRAPRQRFRVLLIFGQRPRRGERVIAA